jgi:hypothetical protein
LAVVSSAVGEPRIKPIVQHPAGSENVSPNARNKCSGAISCPMMFRGIVGAFGQRSVAHNRANRRARKPNVPLDTAPLVLSAVRALADIPIMHRRAVWAKRSLVRSDMSDTSHYTNLCCPQFKAIGVRIATFRRKLAREPG